MQFKGNTTSRTLNVIPVVWDDEAEDFVSGEHDPDAVEREYHIVLHGLTFLLRQRAPYTPPHDYMHQPKDWELRGEDEYTRGMMRHGTTRRDIDSMLHPEEMDTPGDAVDFIDRILSVLVSAETFG